LDGGLGNVIGKDLTGFKKLLGLKIISGSTLFFVTSLVVGLFIFLGLVGLTVLQVPQVPKVPTKKNKNNNNFI
jgi:hypothetical protein